MYSYGFKSSANGNGLGPKPSEWSKTSYVSDGRSRPVIPYAANNDIESYVTKTEIFEHVITPMSMEYAHNPAATRHDPSKTYGINAAADNKWSRSSSPVKDHHGSKEDKWYRSSSPKKGYGYADEKWRRSSSPVKSYGTPEDEWRNRMNSYGFTEEKWRRPSSPVKSYGSTEDKWHKPSSPDQERLEGEQFMNKMPTEGSRLGKFTPIKVTNWRQTPNAGGYYQHNNGYGTDYNDLSNKAWQNRMEPSMVTTGGWTRPGHSTWSSPPNGNLSTSTNDIGTAMEMLKESAISFPASTGSIPRYSVQMAPAPNIGAYSETIDSKEAKRRYKNNLNSVSRPMETYGETIDSREAARRYGGLKIVE